MKNLLREIKKCSKNKYAQQYIVETKDCDDEGKLNMWVLLNLIETMQEEPAECLAEIAPEYKKDLKQVSLKLFNDAHVGDKLEIEARFFEVDKRKVQLKIFVRKVKPDKSTKRICRAGYFFQAVYNNANLA